jgi:CubicO group peptidase (beta-lactamase class C family)
MRTFLLLAFTCMVSLAVAQPNVSRIADIVDAAAAKGFSGVVLVADHGQIVMEKPVGLANIENGDALAGNSKFKIASITKAFTAIVVMQLVQEEKIKLDQTISYYLPSAPIAKSDKITIEDCLLHTSGIPNEGDDAYTQKRTPVEILGMYASNKKDWGKTGVFHYSNLDYLILGLVIEKVTDQPWRDNVSNRILRPLKMKETGFLESGNYPEGLVTGYMTDEKGAMTPEADYLIENFYAAGSMYSSVRDLLKLDQALYSDALLREDALNQMYHTHPELGYVAYGNWVYKYPFLPFNPTLVERRGSIQGFSGVFIRFIDDKYTLIILSNNDRFDPSTYGDRGNLKEQIIMQMGKE